MLGCLVEKSPTLTHAHARTQSMHILCTKSPCGLYVDLHHVSLIHWLFLLGRNDHFLQQSLKTGASCSCAGAGLGCPAAGATSWFRICTSSSAAPVVLATPPSAQLQWKALSISCEYWQLERKWALKGNCTGSLPQKENEKHRLVVDVRLMKQEGHLIPGPEGESARDPDRDLAFR